jgi:hypothetical protein
MGATRPHLQGSNELACASCGRTLLLGERYEPGPDGEPVCELCRLERRGPTADPPPPPAARDRLRLAWRALLGDSDQGERVP